MHNKPTISRFEGSSSYEPGRILFRLLLVYILLDNLIIVSLWFYEKGPAVIRVIINIIINKFMSPWCNWRVDLFASPAPESERNALVMFYNPWYIRIKYASKQH